MYLDCPSKRTIIATADGGYASASDIEGENIIAANISGSMTVLRRFLVHLRPTTTGP
jgi:hypothetical protein